MLKEIDKKCREFLWNATAEKRKIALVAWYKGRVPKKFGGLNRNIDLVGGTFVASDNKEGCDMGKVGE